jgi:UDP-2,3-diacylglucosamine hydrolase
VIVAHFFASDIHLRFDRPDRDARFSNWLTRLRADDSLLIAGDLCDFWMGSRARPKDLLKSASLSRLALFQRSGGALSIMPGNHDTWLCPFYEHELGAQIVPDPSDMTIFGLRLHVVHGHLLGSRRAWKSWMEGHGFFAGFGRLPHPLARALDVALCWNNDRKLIPEEERHLRTFRSYAAKLKGHTDLVVMGHVHRALDEPESQTSPRMVVLGAWEARSSFLKVDEKGASFHIEHVGNHAAADPRPQAAPEQQGKAS